MTGSRLGAGAVAWCLAALLAASAWGCGKSQQECDNLRGEAFDIINEAHPCDSDEDCIGTEWPGCGKPVSSKNFERIGPLREKFKQGSCKEPDRKCPEIPEVYCKQGLCVFREMPTGG